MPRSLELSRAGVFSVYRVTNRLNGKCYIGCTRLSIEKRLGQHRSKAAHGSLHLLHSAMRKYPAGTFTVALVATATSEAEAFALEMSTIKGERTKGHGYNMTDGGETPDAEFCRKAAIQIWQRPEFRETRRKAVIHKHRSKAASNAAKSIWSRPEFPGGSAETGR